MNDIYPLTVVKDRYGGAYSGGKYTAWNMDSHEIPIDIDSDDNMCEAFWVYNTIIVGKGNTMDEAVDNLAKLLENSIDNK